MLQRFYKTLYTFISTAHKAYLETSVGVVVSVVKKRHSHQMHCGFNLYGDHHKVHGKGLFGASSVTIA